MSEIEQRLANVLLQLQVIRMNRHVVYGQAASILSQTEYLFVSALTAH